MEVHDYIDNDHDKQLSARQKQISIQNSFEDSPKEINHHQFTIQGLLENKQSFSIQNRKQSSRRDETKGSQNMQ